MKRVVVSVTNDLVTDQRVSKVCSTLESMGFEILLIGRKLPNSIKIERTYKIVRFNLLFKKGFLFYAEYNIRLFFKLLFLKKDILLSNDLDTLLPNYLISKILKKKLVYDSHELFTEVPELINRPFIQKIWLKIEKNTLPKLKNCLTVSDSIAEYYNKKYDSNFKVIRNFPQKLENRISKKFPFKTAASKIILYQGALNKGRGLEMIIETMPFLNNSILVLIGNGDIESQLMEKVTVLELEKKIKFISKIAPSELRSLTKQADLGISIEEDLGLSYRFSLPNKLFDYIQAKIPVLVSDLPEMNHFVSTYNVGEVIKIREPKKLATQIESLLNKEKEHFKNNLEKASSELIWENEEKKLINIFNNLHLFF